MDVCGYTLAKVLWDVLIHRDGAIALAVLRCRDPSDMMPTWGREINGILLCFLDLEYNGTNHGRTTAMNIYICMYIYADIFI